MTIWKFNLELTDNQNVMMPEGAEIISAQIQASSGLCLWAVVNPLAPKQRREFEVFGTGHAMSQAERRFIGTVQLQGGALVFHVFEKMS